MTVDIPAAFRGQNIVVEFQYRTEEASVASSNGDFMFSVWDKSNGISTTQDSTLVTGTTISAGSDILMTAKAGLAVGDKVWFESGTAATGNSANNVTQTYITEISSTTNNIKVSGDIIVVSGGRALTGFLSDASDVMKAADSDTNKVGTTFKKAVKLAEDTNQINLYWQVKSTTTNQLELFFDGILVSANKFLQASSHPKSGQAMLKDSAGYGTSTGNVIFYFPTETSNTIDANLGIIDNDSVLGTSFTANSKVKVNATFNFNYPLVGSYGGFSVNASGLTTHLPSLTNTTEIVALEHSSHTNSYSSVTCSVTLEKGDVLRPHGDTSLPYSSTRMTLNIQVTPVENDVIILESQDEIFTDWTDYSSELSTVGPANATNTGTDGTYNSTGVIRNSARWRRVAGEMEVEYSFRQTGYGTVSTGLVCIPLPSGYSIDSGKIWSDGIGTTIQGQRVGSLTFSNHPDGVSGANCPGFFYANTDNLTTGVFWANQGSTTYLFGYLDYTTSFNNCSTLYGSFSVPIQGWNSNFNPLLSMPLVDFGTFENSYSARIALDTTIDSQSSEFIASVGKSGTGDYIIAFKSGFFNAAPSITVTVNDGGGNRGCSYYNLSSTGVNVIITVSNTGGAADQPFTLKVQRQGSDYRDPPQATAAVIKPAVAILKDVKTYNVHGDAISAGAWRNVVLNTLEGESWFVTLSGTGSTGLDGTNVEFTLEKGTYKISSVVPFYKTDNTQSRLYDVTNSAVQSIGSSIFSYSSENEDIPSFISGVFTIGVSTQYRLEAFPEGSSGRIGTAAYTMPTSKSVFTIATIEKLK
jgi:hypothetical protein